MRLSIRLATAMIALVLLTVGALSFLSYPESLRASVFAAAIAMLAAALLAAFIAGSVTKEVTAKTAALNREIAQRQRIFDRSLDLILVVDRKGTLLQVSPSSCAILGYQPSEMVGRSAVDFIYPDDLESTREQMRAARHGRVTRNFECRYVRK